MYTGEWRNCTCVEEGGEIQERSDFRYPINRARLGGKPASAREKGPESDCSESDTLRGRCAQFVVSSASGREYESGDRSLRYFPR